MQGRIFGRWTVLKAPPILTSRGERKWLCRCECGTERYVLERGLLHNGSRSCGCLSKERVRKSRGLDLEGKTFGELTVLRVADSKPGYTGISWVCRCSCGALYTVAGTLLHKGRRTHCPDRKAHPRKTRNANIVGKRFGRLIAISPTVRRESGSVVWKCRCDCGNEVLVSYNKLLYSNVRSCGCKKKENNERLKGYLTHVAGTSIDQIGSKKLPSSNTTGYKGVYLIRGKYVAKIVFQQHAYILGTFNDIQPAIEARRSAEKLLFDGTVEYYKKWNARAAADPLWAAENPVQITVTKKPVDGLSVSYSPQL